MGREGERVRERKRESERAHARGRESPRESALAPPFICFFLHLGLPLIELSALASCLYDKDVGTPYKCHASVCSSVLCLVTTKIWGDGH